MVAESVFGKTGLCVVGNLNRDIKTTPIPPSAGLLADGETSADAITETIGGGGANSAAFAAGLGARTALAAKLGNDALGRRLATALQRIGVDTRIAWDSGCDTGTSIALSYEGGARHFVSSLPNNRALAPADVDLPPPGAYPHLLRADVWFSEAMLFGGNAALLREARSRGMATSLDINWDPLWGHADTDTVAERLRAVRDVLPLVTLVHGNVRELTLFAETSDLMAALQRLTRWGAEGVVVHLGADGAGCYRPGDWVVEPPPRVARIRQTTGTGDLLSVCMILLSQCPEGDTRAKLRLANGIVAEFIEGKREFLPRLESR